MTHRGHAIGRHQHQIDLAARSIVERCRVAGAIIHLLLDEVA
jgi:hypothetical protein